MKAGLSTNTPGKQLQDSMSEQYVDQSYISLFQEIFEAQCKIEEKLVLGNIYHSVTSAEVEERNRQELPLIDFNKIRLNETDLHDLLEEIWLIIARYTADENPIVPWLLQAEERGELRLSELALKAAINDRGYLEQISRKIGGDIEYIILIGTLLVSPFLRVCAEPLRKKINLELVQTKRCPVCGGIPLISKFRAGDRKRVLECSLCNTQWVFKRIGCPFCGNQDQGTLGFFYIHEEGAYRVDTCGKCNRYIKTVDQSKKAEDKIMPLLVEDVVTLYLDMLAEKEGFKGIRKSES